MSEFSVTKRGMVERSFAPPGVTGTGRNRFREGFRTPPEETEAPEDPFLYVKAPHDMVTPMHAWRRLCSSTHCEITMATFYRWIRNGQIYTIRMGKKIFVPLSSLEALIDNCLRGEKL